MGCMSNNELKESIFFKVRNSTTKISKKLILSELETQRDECLIFQKI